LQKVLHPEVSGSHAIGDAEGVVEHLHGEDSDLVGRNDDVDLVELPRRELVDGEEDALVVQIVCAVLEGTELWKLAGLLKVTKMEVLFGERHCETLPAVKCQSAHVQVTANQRSVPLATLLHSLHGSLNVIIVTLDLLLVVLLAVT
jgi:hypothetical protein